MNSVKNEIWNGHTIRFVEVKGEWQAVAKDVADALGYETSANMVRHVDEDSKGVHKVNTLGGPQSMLVLSEFGIYDAVFNSHRPEAKQFKRWVYDVIKQLREASGLAGFEVFRQLDKGYQKNAMRKLQAGLKSISRIDYIKANTIADKATSNQFGFDKMVKKSDMTPDMLLSRQSALDSTIALMVANKNLGLGMNVAQTIYNHPINQEDK